MYINIYNYVFLQKLFFNCQLKSKFNLNGWIGNIPENMACEIEGFFLSTKRTDWNAILTSPARLHVFSCFFFFKFVSVMENNFWCEKFLFNIDINEREEAMSSSAESNWDTNAKCCRVSHDDRARFWFKEDSGISSGNNYKVSSQGEIVWWGSSVLRFPL